MKQLSLDDLKSIIRTESGDGIKLLRSLSDNPICSVTVDEDIGCLVIEWKGYATSPQLRFIHESILQLLKKHRFAKILGDDSALPIIHVDDQRWIIEDWMPRAKAAGLKAAANKNPLTYFGRLSVRSVQAVVPADVVIRSFEDLRDARRWLAGIAT